MADNQQSISEEFNLKPPDIALHKQNVHKYFNKNRPPVYERMEENPQQNSPSCFEDRRCRKIYCKLNFHRIPDIQQSISEEFGLKGRNIALLKQNVNKYFSGVLMKTDQLCMKEYRRTSNKTVHPALKIENAEEFIVNSTSIASNDRKRARKCIEILINLGVHNLSTKYSDFN